MDEVGGGGRSDLGANGELFQCVIGVVIHQRAQRRIREPVALVIGVGFGTARTAVGGEVAAGSSPSRATDMPTIISTVDMVSEPINVGTIAVLYSRFGLYQVRLTISPAGQTGQEINV